MHYAFEGKDFLAHYSTSQNWEEVAIVGAY